MRKTGKALCAAGIFAVTLSGVEPSFADTARIAVIGEGQVIAVPDMARISLGVSARGDTAAAALSAAGAQMAGVIAAVEAGGVAARDVQTSQLLVQPLFGDRSSREEAIEIIAYEARSDVTVRVRDLTALGALIDAVAQAGGNAFSGLVFDIQDRGPLNDQARRAAVADGIAKATLYADAAGVGLGSIIEMSEEGATPGPVMMMESAAMRSMPIAVGELEVGARLRMVFELSQ